MIIAREKTVAFTGHRTSKMIELGEGNHLFAKVATKTDQAVLSLCSKGYDTFLTGMAAGFDLMAAESVLKAQKTHPEVRLIAVIPFVGQELKYTTEDQLRYKIILDHVADAVVISEYYHDRAFFVRNDFLIANASLLVCYYIQDKRSGTMYTVNRAIRQNLPVLNIRNHIMP